MGEEDNKRVLVTFSTVEAKQKVIQKADRERRSASSYVACIVEDYHNGTLVRKNNKEKKR